MSDFETPVDIANRALQHCGATRITSFSDDSKNASEVAFCYDKLRRAELRRNVWRFAIRKATLRPIDTDTKFVAFPAWDDGTTYDVNAVIMGTDGLAYYANVGSNLANDPTTSSQWTLYFGPLTATPYDSGTSYFAGEIVYDDSDNAYLSLITGNEDAPPDTTWRLLDAAVLSDFNFIYPLGSGPASTTGSRNVYRLPNGFLRKAPQSPTLGNISWLGSPVGNALTDWEFEGDYFVSTEINPIVFRFVADIADVTKMDAMFCEGLACRIGLEVCETLTQSAEKLSTIAQKYKAFMGEARQVNGIETGATQPAEDAYITVRQ
jgi:hypothetical protein